MISLWTFGLTVPVSIECSGERLLATDAGILNTFVCRQQCLCHSFYDYYRIFKHCLLNSFSEMS